MSINRKLAVQVYSCLLLSTCVQFLFCSSIDPKKSKEGPKKENGNGTSLENRIGLNVQHASAYGRDSDAASSSYSSQDSYAAHAGIYSPDGSYRTMSNLADSDGFGYSSDNSPFTWAKTNSDVRPGYATGNSQAGVDGGWGSAETSGFSTNAEIPLGDTGSVLYSNLISKPINATQSPNAIKNEGNKNNSKPDPDSDRIRKQKQKEEMITFDNN